MQMYQETRSWQDKNERRTIAWQDMPSCQKKYNQTRFFGMSYEVKLEKKLAFRSFSLSLNYLNHFWNHRKKYSKNITNPMSRISKVA